MGYLLFSLKKLLGIMLMPVGLFVLASGAGALWWLKRPRSKTGPVVLFTAWVLFVVLAMPVTGWLLLAPLERAAGNYADPAALTARGVTHIVVLSGAVLDGERVVGDRLGAASSKRVLEGVRLYKRMPGSRLIMSGGRHTSGRVAATAMVKLASELGVLPQAMQSERLSWDTEDQAQRLKALLGRRPFALVTSASHMSRARKLFERQGLHPVSAPTEFFTKGYALNLRSFLPMLGGLRASRAAIYEYLGHAWLWLKGLWS